MNINDWLQAATLVAIIGGFIFFFVHTPKEAHGQMAQRLTGLETAHQTLALRFEGSFAKHDGAIEHLTDAVKELTDEMKSLRQEIQHQQPGKARRAGA